MSPSYQVRWLVDRMHVATSYQDVATDIADRARLAGADRRQVARFTTQAVIAHRRNRRLYEAVMA